jgi:hypothetical protein
MQPRLCGPMVKWEAQSDRPKPENPTGRRNLLSTPSPRLGTYFISESSTPGNTRRARVDLTSSWSRKQIWEKYKGIIIPILSLVLTGLRFFLLGSYPPRLGKARKIEQFPSSAREASSPEATWSLSSLTSIKSFKNPV